MTSSTLPGWPVVTATVRKDGIGEVVRIPAVAAAALVLTVTLAGCVSPSPEAQPTLKPTSSATSTPNPDGPSDAVETPPSLPAAGSEASGSAIAAAENVMTLFARPSLDAQAWIDGLYPFLTEAAGFAYEGTDPSNVPCSQVTGAGTVTGEPTEYAVIVQVPTDAGLYNISLTRTGPDAEWLADRIRPAEG